MQSRFVFWAWWGGYYWGKRVSFAFVLYIPEKHSGWACALTIFFLLWYFDLLATNGRLDVDLVHHPASCVDACCPALQMLPAKEVYGAKAEGLKCFSPSLCGGEENRCGVGSLWLSNHNNFNLGYNDWKTDFIRSFETKRLERELSSLINFGSWFFHSPHPPKIISLVSVNVMAAAGLNESVLKQCHPLLCDEKLARGACRSRGGGHVPAIYFDSAAFMTQTRFSCIQAVWLHLHTFASWVNIWYLSLWLIKMQRKWTLLCPKSSLSEPWDLRLNVLPWIYASSVLSVSIPSCVLCPVLLGPFHMWPPLSRYEFDRWPMQC